MTARSQTPAVLLFAGLALFPFAARFGAQAYLLSLGARTLILALAALSLDFLVGQAALVSFGHAAYLGIGAYAVVLASMAGIDDLPAQALAGVVAAALFAALTGYVSLRARGVYYIMSTLAFGQMLYFLFVSLSALGGDDGYTLPNRSRLIGEPRLTSDFSFLLSLPRRACPCISAAGANRRFALWPRSQRDSAESPARWSAWLSGLPVPAGRLVIAGAIGAIAGTLLANQSEFVAPAFMSWQRSGELLVMTILGGVGSLWGAVLGAIVYLTLEEALSLLTDQTHVLLGPLLVAVAFFGPRGLAGGAPAPTAAGGEA
jgi:branched-chain amino acid transport system permease protein